MLEWKLGGGFVNTHKLFSSHIDLLVVAFGSGYGITADDFRTDLSWKTLEELHDNVRTVATQTLKLKLCEPNTPL